MTWQEISREASKVVTSLRGMKEDIKPASVIKRQADGVLEMIQEFEMGNLTITPELAERLEQQRMECENHIMTFQKHIAEAGFQQASLFDL